MALSATDWVPGGSTVDDAVVFARALVARGCDAIEVLAGQTTADAVAIYDAVALIRLSDRIRNEVPVPTLSAAGVRFADDVNNIVASGRADLCFIDPLSVNVHLRPIRAAESPLELSTDASVLPIAEAAHG